MPAKLLTEAMRDVSGLMPSGVRITEEKK